jgi:hypothetical protein
MVLLEHGDVRAPARQLASSSETGIAATDDGNVGKGREWGGGAAGQLNLFRPETSLDHRPAHFARARRSAR